ncbi:SMI1/KNR4 family protein [Chitinophaga nivalis]|uniref:SMI1/KNR4 family protein n=1 Tax=Chitinophaga nivalis TaxID=2991709 RepID=A0ABT3IEI4_9BACT|nr:SMI1/KNR4 family protein [Chitinophaga nivalis]MCW3467941.1 SMI1/KNR4 family protein [Chitinophaga nivalis]MCW3482368.1 SMI1/KNR4 family protein [Chitinophaga nivalis]
MEYQDYINFFSANRSKEDLLMDLDTILRNDFKLIINDEFYFSFIEDINNCGFFFNQSLQFYSFSEERDFRNISVVNENFSKEYGELFKGLVAFGQDVFGNQFAFHTEKGGVVSFDIETAVQTIVAESFEEWLIKLNDDLNYIAGISYVDEWKEHNDLSWNQRIIGKMPFVLGGAYGLENFNASTFPNYIACNAHLAKQVYNLKDGEKIKLVIREDG